MTPGDPLFEEGAEYLLGAASLEQARNVYRPLRAALEPTGAFRFIDSVTRLGITHKSPAIRSSESCRVMPRPPSGLWETPMAVLDEGGSVGDGGRKPDVRRSGHGAR